MAAEGFLQILMDTMVQSWLLAPNAVVAAAEAGFKSADAPGEEQRHHPVHAGNGDVGFPVAGRSARDSTGGVGEFGQTDGGDERGSFRIAMALLPSAGSMRRKACGRMIVRMACM